MISNTWQPGLLKLKRNFWTPILMRCTEDIKKMFLPSSEVNKDPVLYLHWMSNCFLSLINESSKKESCQTEPGVGRDFSGGILGVSPHDGRDHGSFPVLAHRWCSRNPVNV